MAGQVENTGMTPMQTLDSLRQQIVADGKVTQEEVQLFKQNCNTMLANKEITDENFNEALGWFKNTSIAQVQVIKKEKDDVNKKLHKNFISGGLKGGLIGAIAGLIGIENYHINKIDYPIRSLLYDKLTGLPENTRFRYEIPEYKNLSEGADIFIKSYGKHYKHCFLPDDIVKRGMHANRNRLIAVGIGLVLGVLFGLFWEKVKFLDER